jgi:cytochrome c oxidase subunit II
MWFQTSKTGLFLGQCAEYCGTQHAGMLIRVVVDMQSNFEKWVANEQKPAVEEASVSKGKQAFLAQTCVNCHRIHGTTAQGTYAPDLTHLMSRQTLASGMVPNTPENLQRWIADPQKIKEGALMPGFGLSEAEQEAIVQYLLTLK